MPDASIFCSPASGRAVHTSSRHGPASTVGAGFIVGARIAIPALLALSAAISWFCLRRRGRLYMPLSVLCATIEMGSAVVWIQLRFMKRMEGH